MNRLERAEKTNQAEVLRQVLTNWQAGIWTALPATVQSYNAAAQTCSVQPTIQLVRYPRAGGNPIPLDFPVIPDVPVVFPGGGGYSLTFPIAAGDEVLLVFASRCIDAWWKLGTSTSKSQPQTESRMHDLSDAFAIVGPRNQTRMLNPSPAGSSVQLRSDDGQAIIEVAANHVINITTQGNVNVTSQGTATVKAPTINLQNAGSALKKLVKDTFITLFNAHVHTSAVAGNPTSVPILPSTTDVTTVVNAE
jgi:hypothetical protein